MIAGTTAFGYLAKFEEVRIRITKDEKDELKYHSDKMGESMSEFVKRAMENPISPRPNEARKPKEFDPLDRDVTQDKYKFYRI